MECCWQWKLAEEGLADHLADSWVGAGVMLVEGLKGRWNRKGSGWYKEVMILTKSLAGLA